MYWQRSLNVTATRVVVWRRAMRSLWRYGDAFCARVGYISLLCGSSIQHQLWRIHLLGSFSAAPYPRPTKELLLSESLSHLNLVLPNCSQFRIRHPDQPLLSQLQVLPSMQLA